MEAVYTDTARALQLITSPPTPQRDVAHPVDNLLEALSEVGQAVSVADEDMDCFTWEELKAIDQSLCLDHLNYQVSSSLEASLKYNLLQGCCSADLLLQRK